MTQRRIIDWDDGVTLEAPVINIHHDPTCPRRYASHEAEAGRPLIDWMVDCYPGGFGGPIVVHRNGEPVPIAEADFKMEPGDVIHILVQPGAPGLGAMIVASLIVAAISAVAMIAYNLIMGKPRQPKAQDQAAPDPVYSISAAQNAARILEPVPVLYGRMVTVPDYASQPYVFFADNQQYLDMLMCIGQGEHVLHEVQVGETPVSALESNAVEYWLFGPDDHDQTMGTIEGLTGIMENVVTSPEVADQELNGAGPPSAGSSYFEYVIPATFAAPNTITFEEDTAEDLTAYANVQVIGTAHNNGVYAITSATGFGVTVGGGIENEGPTIGAKTFRFYNDAGALAIGPFVTCKPGVQGNRIMADFVFPQGLYTANASTGALEPLSVNLTLEYQKLADDGTPIGGWTAYPITVTGSTNTPLRQTYSIDVAAGRYRVRAQRLSAPPGSTREVSSLVWTGLKFRLLNTLTPVYGPVTLLAVRIRATNGIAGNATSRVRAEVTRKLPIMGLGPLTPTTNPADAFFDVMINTVYGARRPRSECDVAELERLVDHWAGRAHFNGGFTQKSTVWEALTMVLQTAGCAPLPLGQVMSVTQDGVKAVRRQLFSDANMTRATLAIGYAFDKPGDNDGVEVEYRDPKTFNPLYKTWPAGAQDPDKVVLFGSTDGVQAEQFARLIWQKTTRLRKTAGFETELEGLLARHGDRIGVATQLPHWGKAGVVIEVAGTTLVLDDAPDWSGTGHFVVLRNELGEPSDPITVTQGDEANEVVLASAPPFALFGTGDQEPTHYAFGDAVTLLRDFTITNVQHSGGSQVALEAILYDPAVYADTLPWMEEPI
jgi:hypothetical protein